MTVRLEPGDCVEVMRRLAAEGLGVDSVVCDPPYELGFMGRGWDRSGIANDPATWRAALDILPPGGHLVAFSGTRTYHRMACAIEDAGFEIRDQLAWAYGSGFPKSHDVSKAIDKAAGVEREVLVSGKPVKRMIPGADQDATGSWVKDNGREFVPTVTAAATDAARQWEGWGTALKPAWEPICLARKPLIGTVAANVIAHGVGALNIDGCRIGIVGDRRSPCGADGIQHRATGDVYGKHKTTEGFDVALGRWPANVMHDGGDEVMEAFAASGEKNGGHHPVARGKGNISTSGHAGQDGLAERHSDTGTAARFFFSAKAGSEDRWGSKHPTVKPVELMRWLVRLVTPPGGTVLDPFAGSGTTGVACLAEGFSGILIERETEYQADILARLDHYAGRGGHSLAVKGRKGDAGKAGGTDTPLFKGLI